MTRPIKQRTPPIHPTSSEYALQAKALEQGGKPAEVLVKAARDLLVAAAIYRETGRQRIWLGSAADRFLRLEHGDKAEAVTDPLQLCGHAAEVLCRYL